MSNPTSPSPPRGSSGSRPSRYWVAVPANAPGLVPVAHHPRRVTASEVLASDRHPALDQPGTTTMRSRL
jgi:hypothetical protein